jgi:hypothetical protein
MEAIEEKQGPSNQKQTKKQESNNGDTRVNRLERKLTI